MDKFIEEKLNSKEQEKRFLEWVNARDDDWWEDEARISIWDFRIMKEFFNEDFEQALSDAIKYGREMKPEPNWHYIDGVWIHIVHEGDKIYVNGKLTTSQEEG